MHDGNSGVPVSSEIAESWRRSRLSGLRPDRFDPGRTEVDTETGFMRTAVPVLRGMARLLAGTDTSLAVAEPGGRILWRWVENPALAAVLDRYSVDTGFDFNEQCIGTNGLGTALETGRIMTVRGDEHFSEPLRIFTCVAAPVRHPITRRVVGALNLTCRVENTHPLLAPVVRRLVREVQDKLFEESSPRDRQLLHGFLTAPRVGDRPVVSLSEDLCITNSAAGRLGLDQRLLWERAQAGGTGGDCEFAVPGNEGLLARCRPLTEDGRLVGAVLVLHDAREHEVRRSAVRDGQRPEWTDLVERVAGLARRGQPPHVAGERGVGRTTLLREGLERAVGEAVPVVDAASQQAEGTRAWIARLRERLAGQRAFILRDGDLLDERAARALRALADESTPGPLLAVTSAPPGGEFRAALSELVGEPHVELPPLRERADDVLELARNLLGATHTDCFTPSAAAVLGQYEWPGNLTELKQVIEDLAGPAAHGPIGVDDLPPRLRDLRGRRVLSPLERAEAGVITAALRDCRHNKAETARFLRISRTSLYQKMRAYRIAAN